MSEVKRIMVIDCRSAGISGDMILGALLDLGADLNKIQETMEYVQSSIKGCDRIELLVNDVIRKGFRGKMVEIKTKETVTSRTGGELKNALTQIIDVLKPSREAERIAMDSTNTLVEVEAMLHGETVDEVQLHEAGSADTLADIVGVTIALEDLNLTRDTIVYSMPVAVGGGLVTFSHGTVSAPAPATLEILRSKSFHIVGGPIKSELSTPTGVSLLTNIVNIVSDFYPAMKPTRMGYGAGAKDYPEVPNILRIVVGTPVNDFVSDEVGILETNLDDTSGEVVGYTMERLFNEGAKDVSIIPMFTKKNRPGHILKVIADKKDVEHLVRVLVDETGTLGVRVYHCGRHVLTRQTTLVKIDIDKASHHIRVKIARDQRGNIVQVKPEYDDVVKLARETNKPYRDVMDIVSRKSISLIKNEG